MLSTSCIRYSLTTFMCVKLVISYSNVFFIFIAFYVMCNNFLYNDMNMLINVQVKMNSVSTPAVLCLVLSLVCLFVRPSASITCYSCISSAGQGCGAPFVRATAVSITALPDGKPCGLCYTMRYTDICNYLLIFIDFIFKVCQLSYTKLEIETGLN